MRTLNIRYSSQKNRGGIPTETYISQQPKDIESRNWYQIIAMTKFSNHVIRCINKLTVLCLKYLRKLKILEKNQWQTKWVYQ